MTLGRQHTCSMTPDSCETTNQTACQPSLFSGVPHGAMEILFAPASAIMQSAISTHARRNSKYSQQL